MDTLVASVSPGTRSSPESAAAPRARFLFAAWAVVVVAFLQPDLYSNEAVYLVRGRRLLDPTFLAADWTFGAGGSSASFTILFDSVAALLWSALGDAHRVAHAARLVAWALLVPGVALFASHLGARGPWFLGGLALFLAGGQGYAAREWLFAGGEQKCFAYAALLFAIDRAVRGRLASAGALTGLAVAFHVLVGGWGGLALGVALLCNARRFGAAGLLRFGLAAAVVAAPALLLALRYLGAPVPEAGPGLLAERFVLLRNPHHLDPATFLSFQRGALFFLVGVATCWAVLRTAPADAARLLLPFLIVLAALYLGGIAARRLELFGVLKFYPFRTGDVLLPLAFWLSVPRALAAAWRARGPQRVARRAPGIAAAVVAALLLYAQSDRCADFLARLGRQGRGIWHGELAHGGELGSTARWIRAHSARDSVFATHPCRFEFWLAAERATVVSFASAPANARFLEWYARMVALNGGRDFTQRGFSVCEEIADHFAALSAERLRSLRARYGASFYLVESERPDLARALVFRDERAFVYALSRLEERTPSAD